jgi:type II secretory ATPase GspE/PulE/Tfp pilus assembly ATPase PilB-like protein
VGSGAPPEKLLSVLAKRRFTTLFDDAAEKAASGITTPDEIRRELGKPL